MEDKLVSLRRMLDPGDSDPDVDILSLRNSMTSWMETFQQRFKGFLLFFVFVWLSFWGKLFFHFKILTSF